MTEPLNVEPIRRLSDRYRQMTARKGDDPASVAHRAAGLAELVPDLLAEIERMQAVENKVRELAGVWVAVPSRDVLRALDGGR